MIRFDLAWTISSSFFQNKFIKRTSPVIRIKAAMMMMTVKLRPLSSGVGAGVGE
uniref:Uncharacterized protein n=1 Tax=viral metagenome TaxID=1070528 RepID=A0A6C0C300_9ZZZZ